MVTLSRHMQDRGLLYGHPFVLPPGKPRDWQAIQGLSRSRQCSARKMPPMPSRS